MNFPPPPPRRKIIVPPGHILLQPNNTFSDMPSMLKWVAINCCPKAKVAKVWNVEGKLACLVITPTPKAHT